MDEPRTPRLSTQETRIHDGDSAAPLLYFAVQNNFSGVHGIWCLNDDPDHEVHIEPDGRERCLIKRPKEPQMIQVNMVFIGLISSECIHPHLSLSPWTAASPLTNELALTG